MAVGHLHSCLGTEDFLPVRGSPRGQLGPGGGSSMPALHGPADPTAEQEAARPWLGRPGLGLGHTASGLRSSSGTSLTTLSKLLQSPGALSVHLPVATVQC